MQYYSVILRFTILKQDRKQEIILATYVNKNEPIIEYKLIKTKERTAKVFAATAGYGVYSGKTHGELGLLNTSDLCNEIHVWSWDGMPVKRFILNKPISNFAVSLDDSYILLYSFKEDDVLYKMNCN